MSIQVVRRARLSASVRHPVNPLLTSRLHRLASRLLGQRASGGMDERMEAMLPPVLSPTIGRIVKQIELRIATTTD